MARIIFSITIIFAGLFCGLLFIADASDSRAMRDARRDIAKTPPAIPFPENDDLNSLPSSTFSNGTTFPEAVTVSLKNTFVETRPRNNNLKTKPYAASSARRAPTLQVSALRRSYL